MGPSPQGPERYCSPYPRRLRVSTVEPTCGDGWQLSGGPSFAEVDQHLLTTESGNLLSRAIRHRARLGPTAAADPAPRVTGRAQASAHSAPRGVTALLSVIVNVNMLSVPSWPRQTLWIWLAFGAK